MGHLFTHTPASDDHNSRLYDSRRRRSNFGYFEPPVVDDTLLLALPPFARVHSRIVSMNGKTWILWSPNSIIDVFYPGIRSPGYEVVMEKEWMKRRFDGHLGRFDPTKSPQHYDPQQPWLALLRRERKALTKIEYIPLVIAWVSLPRQGKDMDLGRLDTAYLLQLTTRNIKLDATISAMIDISTIKLDYLENRPLRPLESEVKELGGVLHFADAVDKVAAVQRWLRLKNAWI